MLGPCWGHVGHVGTMLGPCWGQALAILGPCWGHVELKSGVFLLGHDQPEKEHAGFGSCWGPCWAMLGSCWPCWGHVRAKPWPCWGHVELVFCQEQRVPLGHDQPQKEHASFGSWWACVGSFDVLYGVPWRCCAISFERGPHCEIMNPLTPRTPFKGNLVILLRFDTSRLTRTHHYWPSLTGSISKFPVGLAPTHGPHEVLENPRFWTLGT